MQRRVSFDLECEVITADGAFNCFVEGDGFVDTCNYGADADGNRGMKMVSYSDIDIDLIGYLDESDNYQVILWSAVKNQDHVMDSIKDFLLQAHLSNP